MTGSVYTKLLELGDGNERCTFKISESSLLVNVFKIPIPMTYLNSHLLSPTYYHKIVTDLFLFLEDI